MNEKENKEVLLFVPRFESGGAESFIVNVAEELVAMGMSCRVLSIDGSPSVYDSRLLSIGVEREVLMRDSHSNPIVKYLRAYRLFDYYLSQRSKRICAIHFNLAQGEDLPFVRMSKHHGIERRIVHSHNSSATNVIKKIGHVVFKRIFGEEGTVYCACSNQAARWLFTKSIIKNNRYFLVKNGIHTLNYRFSESSRHKARFMLGVKEGTKLSLFVGRLSKQKNLEYLLREFARTIISDPNQMLAIVGEGALENELKEVASTLDIDSHLLWLGQRSDIPDLMSAADIFILPSIFEGFPFTLVEAQTSGLPCIVSDRVSQECRLTASIQYVPLLPGSFSDAILRTHANSCEKRIEGFNEVRSAKYDIRDTAENLMQAYGA